jgi:F0F1-type ATP synthase membrane subunit b/b'
VDLDRQTIEKRDFPIGRRGYEPEAVDSHLRDVAEEVDSLRRAARSNQRGESLASAASAQVQAIVEAAETTAADIERQAQMEAQRIRQEADRAAERTRGEAIERAQGHVQSVSQATSMMLQRIDAMESELGALVESLRTGANRLTADLTLLEGNMSDLYDASGRVAGAPAGAKPPRPEPPVEPVAVIEEELILEEIEPADEAALLGEPELEFEQEQALADEVALPELELEELEEEQALAGPAPVEEFEEEFVPPPVAAEPPPPAAEPPPPAEAAIPEPAGGESRTTSADVDGARLIALNMALNGQSREDADRYLAENFDLPDRTALLDEVFAAVEG